MATPTYRPIASITLGSSASSVTFSSIPQDYRDLVLVVAGQQTTGDNYLIYFNSDTTSANYSYVYMEGTGSSANSGNGTGAFASISDDTISNSITQIMDYSATDKDKTFLNRSNPSDRWTIALAMRWANTSAITSIELDASSSGTFNTGSTFALYGIEA